VKLIVLDRLIALKEHPSHERVLQDLVMDILRVLASPDLEVRKKTLNLGKLILTINMQKLANHMFIRAACNSQRRTVLYIGDLIILSQNTILS
jgi:vesicle coat complex subunit